MKRIMITANQVKQFALDNGADLAGVAQVDQFAAAPAGHRPGDLMVGAKVVVVCAKSIPVGVLDSPPSVYHRAMEVAHITLDQLAGKIALFMEEAGARAIPVPADEPYQHWQAERCYGRGDLSHKHAAQAAGLGRLGKNSLLITPRFGNMVHLVSVISDIELAGESMMTGDPCPVDCNLCLQVCPAGAIGEDQEVNQELCRKVLMQQLPKGMIVESCNACRRVCPAGR